MLMNKVHGFSLIELLLAMLIGSSLLLAIATLYPHLYRYSINIYRQFRLEQSLRQAVISLEKDLRRAGFMLPEPSAYVVTTTATEHQPFFCIVIYYNFQRDGYWQAVATATDTFAYRLHNGQFAHKRGSSDCHSRDWEQLIDPMEVVVTSFSVQQINIPAQQRSYFLIVLAAHWYHQPTIHYRQVSIIAGENL